MNKLIPKSYSACALAVVAVMVIFGLMFSTVVGSFAMKCIGVLLFGALSLGVFVGFVCLPVSHDWDIDVFAYVIVSGLVVGLIGGLLGWF